MATSFWKRAAVLVAVLGIADAGSALRAQNLVNNPGFDSGLDGWQHLLNTALWDGAADANGSPSSGSVHGFVSDAIPNGFTTVVSQCVPLEVGRHYHLGAKILLPQAQATAGSAFLLLTPYPCADCSCPPPPSFGPILQTAPVSARGAWTDSALEFDNGYPSAMVTASLGPTAGGLFEARFDDVWLGEGAPPCSANATTLCLLGGRFALTARYDAGTAGGAGDAHTATLGDGGYLWFFAPGNVEAVVKMLDGCALNHHFWFFAAGLTNVDVDITLRDTASGQTRTYHSKAGTAFEPIQDIAAFACPAS